MSAARKPVISIEQDILAIGSAQQFVAGNAQHLCFQVEERHVDSTDRTEAGSVRADPVQVSVELRPDKIRLHRIETDDTLPYMLGSFKDDRASRPVGRFAHTGISFVRIYFK